MSGEFEFNPYNIKLTKHEKDALVREVMMERRLDAENEEDVELLTEEEKQVLFAQELKDHQDWALYRLKRKNEGTMNADDFIKSPYEWKELRIERENKQKAIAEEEKSMRIWKADMTSCYIYRNIESRINLRPKIIILPDSDEYFVVFNLSKTSPQIKSEFSVIKTVKELRKLEQGRTQSSPKHPLKLWISKQHDCFASYYNVGKNPLKEQLESLTDVGCSE